MRWKYLKSSRLNKEEQAECSNNGKNPDEFAPFPNLCAIKLPDGNEIEECEPTVDAKSVACNRCEESAHERRKRKEEECEKNIDERSCDTDFPVAFQVDGARVDHDCARCGKNKAEKAHDKCEEEHFVKAAEFCLESVALRDDFVAEFVEQEAAADYDECDDETLEKAADVILVAKDNAKGE